MYAPGTNYSVLEVWAPFYASALPICEAVSRIMLDDWTRAKGSRRSHNLGQGWSRKAKNRLFKDLTIPMKLTELLPEKFKHHNCADTTSKLALTSMPHLKSLIGT